MAAGVGLLKGNTKTRFSKTLGARPLRAASDESRLDPFSAALRSIGFWCPLKKKKLAAIAVEDDSLE